MNDNTSDIEDTLEALRAESYTNLPTGLVNDLVQIEYDTLEDRKESAKRIRKRVEESLSEDD